MSEVRATQMISAVVPRTVVEQLQQIARSEDRSFSAEVRRALRNHATANANATTTTGDGAPVLHREGPRPSSR